MIITQINATESAEAAILDFIDESVRALQDAGVEPRFVVVGQDAYEELREEVGRRFGRSAGTFESYQWLSIVVDPFRRGEVCVLPAPSAMVGGVRTEQV
jgi:hypothetical protein